MLKGGGGGRVEVPVKLVLIQIFDRTPPKTHNNNIQIHKLQTLKKKKSSKKFNIRRTNKTEGHKSRRHAVFVFQSVFIFSTVQTLVSKCDFQSLLGRDGFQWFCLVSANA